MTKMNSIKKIAAAMVLVVMTTGCAFAAPAPKVAKGNDRPAAQKIAPAKKAEHRAEHKAEPRAERRGEKRELHHASPAPRAAAPAPAPVVAAAPAPAPVVVVDHHDHDLVDGLVFGAGVGIGRAVTDAILNND